MSTTRNLFSRFKRFITTNKTVRYATYFTMAGISQLLDATLNQKLEGHQIGDYYSEAPSRIAWLLLSSMFLGINFEYVFQTFQNEQERKEGIISDRISAKKLWVTCTTAYTGHFLIEKALSTPISGENAIYILCSTAINGPLWGTLSTSAGYLLQKFNYNILPFTSTHVVLMGMGILVSTLQEIFDFMCKQMIDHDSLDWDSLTSPKRLLALHVYHSLLQGFIYGISFCNTKKYSQTEDIENEAIIIKFRNILITTSAILTPISIFTQQALTIPINLKNAGYIIGDSLSTGVPYGLSSGCTLFTLVKLQIDYKQYQSRLLTDNRPSNREPFLYRNHLLATNRVDSEEHKDVERGGEYVPPAQIQIFSKS